MTDHPHSLGNLPERNFHRQTGYSGRRTSPAKRRQRIRGCGVPATVWFTPRSESTILGETRNDAQLREPDPWALAEIIRQFAAPGQQYTVARVTHPADHAETTVTAYRRESAPESGGDCETVQTGELNDLVAVIPAESNDRDEHESARRVIQDAFRASLAQYIEFAHRTLRDGGILAIQVPRPAPGPDFRDDTGKTIKAAREKGFAYLQHIALVDSHIADDEGIIPDLPHQDLDAFRTARAHGFRVHARSHSDLLVFHKLAKAEPLD